jgi:hypothetical protein
LASKGSTRIDNRNIIADPLSQIGKHLSDMRGTGGDDPNGRSKDVQERLAIRRVNELALAGGDGLLKVIGPGGLETIDAARPRAELGEYAKRATRAPCFQDSIDVVCVGGSTERFHNYPDRSAAGEARAPSRLIGNTEFEKFWSTRRNDACCFRDHVDFDATARNGTFEPTVRRNSELASHRYWR